jgi:hypothetical protein
MLYRITEDIVIDLDHLVAMETRTAGGFGPSTILTLQVGNEAVTISAPGPCAEDIMRELEEAARKEAEAAEEQFNRPFKRPHFPSPYSRSGD